MAMIVLVGCTGEKRVMIKELCYKKGTGEIVCPESVDEAKE